MEVVTKINVSTLTLLSGLLFVPSVDCTQTKPRKGANWPVSMDQLSKVHSRIQCMKNGSGQPERSSTPLCQDATKKREEEKKENPESLSIYSKEIYILSKINITIRSHGGVRWIKGSKTQAEFRVDSI